MSHSDELNLEKKAVPKIAQKALPNIILTAESLHATGQYCGCNPCRYTGMWFFICAISLLPPLPPLSVRQRAGGRNASTDGAMFHTHLSCISYIHTYRYATYWRKKKK